MIFFDNSLVVDHKERGTRSAVRRVLICFFSALLLTSLGNNVSHAATWSDVLQRYDGWEDPDLSSTSVTARAAHLNEISTTLASAQTLCGAAVSALPTIAANSRFYASTTNDFRSAIRNLYLSPGAHAPQSGLANSVWAPGVASGQRVYRAHIQDMRDALDRIGLVCRAVCGNNIQEAGETCDLGPGSLGACWNPCSLTCQSNVCPPCGNGTIDAGETCENCSPDVGLCCGNGVPNAGEICDNGASNGGCPQTCSASCTINTCPPAPTCSDGIQNQSETQIDCGGPNCAACPCIPNGQADDDPIPCPGPVCGSLVVRPASSCCSGFSRYTCSACGTQQITDINGGCYAGNCTDGYQNNGELGIDCGGPCAACAAVCTSNSFMFWNIMNSAGSYDAVNCCARAAATSLEQRNVCIATNGTITQNVTSNFPYAIGYEPGALTRNADCSCDYDGAAYAPCNSNGIQDNGEIGIDCGGGGCFNCPVAPTCFDLIQNQGETAIDCGGPCTACCGNSRVDAGLGEQCDTGGARGVCPAACSTNCTTNACGCNNDGSQNNGETGIDCGGGGCGACGSCGRIASSCYGCSGASCIQVGTGTFTEATCGGTCVAPACYCQDVQSVWGVGPYGCDHYIGCYASAASCVTGSGTCASFTTACLPEYNLANCATSGCGNNWVDSGCGTLGCPGTEMGQTNNCVGPSCGANCEGVGTARCVPSGACAGLGCNLPWGGTISSGQSVTAYQASSVACGNSCVSETRTCNNGTLSGGYLNLSCSVTGCAGCTFNAGSPWDACIADSTVSAAHLGSAMAVDTVGPSTGSISASCNNGSWTVTGQTCSVNGACGTANSTPVASAPTSNLCSQGTTTAVSGTGPWAWSCNGLNGGTNASCGAPPVGGCTIYHPISWDGPGVTCVEFFRAANDPSPFITTYMSNGQIVTTLAGSCVFGQCWGSLDYICTNGGMVTLSSSCQAGSEL